MIIIIMTIDVPHFVKKLGGELMISCISSVLNSCFLILLFIVN